MITENYKVVSPAYGRDYKNGQLAGEAFKNGGDFKMESMGMGGTYCSIRDFAKGTVVTIRYNGMKNTRNYVV